MWWERPADNPWAPDPATTTPATPLRQASAIPDPNTIGFVQTNLRLFLLFYYQQIVYKTFMMISSKL